MNSSSKINKTTDNKEIDSSQQSELIKSKNKNLKKSNKTDKYKDTNNKTFNDEEMNSLSYEDALKYDTRTFSEYYLSLLRTNHILIFSFFQSNDYNSKIIKIYIFFFTFVIDYAISAMFYSDSTMHKIYEDDGSFDFTYQLPIMIYSMLISSFLKILLNYFGLYESNIIDIKKEDFKYINLKKEMFKIKFKIL